MPEPQIASRPSANAPVSNDIVQSYFDSLLREISLPAVEVEHEGPAPAFEQEHKVNQEETDEPLPAVEIRPRPDMIVDIAATASLTEHNPQSARVVPDWGRQGFAGLVFEVAGLKMAAPLHLLGGISLLEDNLQPVVAQADWFMGLLRWNGKNLRVVDTARFVMPERLPDNSHRSQYNNVIVLGDSLWALAVDKADESVHLDTAEIRWKTVTGNRPWLAGTLLQRLCALIDVETLIQLLKACDRTIIHDTGHGDAAGISNQDQSIQ
jgi:purine-binding chemotaxis protein CheW